jgi:hypothetical protein
VQLYRAGEPSLAQNVGLYLAEGLKRGDGVLVIAAPEHTALFRNHLEQQGIDVASARENRQLVMWDAQETLAQFLVDGQPDWHKFEAAIQVGIRQLPAANRDTGLRAYGEMVGILWQNRQFAAAVRLEQFWNRLLEQAAFSLYCAYSIDIFGQDFHVGNLDGVLCTHTHLIPTEPNGNLEAALNRALDEILGADAEPLRVLIKKSDLPGRAVMPNAETMVMWLKNHLPARADAIVQRARQHYNRSALAVL